MIIPTKQLKIWNSLKEQGDLTQMESISETITGIKVTRQNLSRALDRGRCSETAYKVLKTYFGKKEVALSR